MLHLQPRQPRLRLILVLCSEEGRAASERTRNTAKAAQRGTRREAGLQLAARGCSDGFFTLQLRQKHNAGVISAKRTQQREAQLCCAARRGTHRCCELRAARARGREVGARGGELGCESRHIRVARRRRVARCQRRLARLGARLGVEQRAQVIST